MCMSGGKALALRGGATSAGTKVVLAQKTGMDSQLWTFIDAGDGYVRIVPKLAQSKAMETPKGCAVKKTSIEIGSGATPLSQLFKPSKTSILGKYCSAQAVSPTSSMPTKYSLALNKGSTSNIINTTGAPTLQVAYEAPNVGKFKTAIKISGPEQKGTVGRTFKRIGTYDGHSIDMTIVAVDWSDEELKPDAHLSVDSIYDVSYHGVYQVVWRYFFTESSSSQAVAISGFNTFLDIDGVERLESQWGMDYLWCLNTSSYERQSGYTAALTSTTGINSTDFTDDNYNVTGLFSNTSS
ncbi:MAG: RICIN domain-containing protein, partial [Raoultibacter sp.]